MNTQLREVGLTPAARVEALRQIVIDAPMLMDVLSRMRLFGLPDCWLVSGAIYNSVWNRLTGRPALTGIRDIDLFYFDPSDLSYEAEDRVIRAGAALFGGLPVPVEIRNQARVHLWFEAHFGVSYAPLGSSREGVDRFAATAHAVAARLDADGRVEIYAPYGLEALFGLRLEPNRCLDNRETYDRKAARALQVWPELTVLPW